MNVLFVTWDGPAQNYLESLFFPIFEEVSKRRTDIHFGVIQFTWGDGSVERSVSSTATRKGIWYESITVPRRPLAAATAVSIAAGAAKVVDATRRFGADVLLPRAIIPAGMVLLASKLLPDVRILFDADGFMADERAEFGGWSKSGLQYRLFRDIETQTAVKADAIMVRTERAMNILADRAGSFHNDKYFVIPNGKDSCGFRPLPESQRRQFRAQFGVSDDAPWLIYVGSLGPQYYPREMVRLFTCVLDHEPRARWTVLTGNPSPIQPHLRESGLLEDVDIRRVPPDKVPTWVAAADVGLALRRATFSQRGVCPIKVAEYLLCGTPVIATADVGDLDHQLSRPFTGRVLGELDEAAFEETAVWISTVMADRSRFRDACRELGEVHFSLGKCAEHYISALDFALRP